MLSHMSTAMSTTMAKILKEVMHTKNNTLLNQKTNIPYNMENITGILTWALPNIIASKTMENVAYYKWDGEDNVLQEPTAVHYKNGSWNNIGNKNSWNVQTKTITLEDLTTIDTIDLSEYAELANEDIPCITINIGEGTVNKLVLVVNNTEKKNIVVTLKHNEIPFPDEKTTYTLIYGSKQFICITNGEIAEFKPIFFE